MSSPSSLAPESDHLRKITERFSEIGVAQIADSAAEIAQVLDLPLRPRTSATHVCGPVFPVATDDDMLPCLQALAAAPEGAVLFVANRTRRSQAIVGDIFATAAECQGLAGVVVDGAVRDLTDLASMRIPIFSTSVTYVSARTTSKRSREVPATVVSGGIELAPGDWIFGDPDGFCVVGEAHVDVVVMGAKVLRQRENMLKEQLRAGRRFEEATGLDKFLAGTGSLGFVP